MKLAKKNPNQNKKINFQQESNPKRKINPEIRKKNFYISSYLILAIK